MTISLDKYKFSDVDRELIAKVINDMLFTMKYGISGETTKKFSTAMLFHGCLLAKYPTPKSCPKANILCAVIGGLISDIIDKRGFEELADYLRAFNDHIDRQV